MGQDADTGHAKLMLHVSVDTGLAYPILLGVWFDVSDKQQHPGEPAQSFLNNVGRIPQGRRDQKDGSDNAEYSHDWHTPLLSHRSRSPSALYLTLSKGDYRLVSRLRKGTEERQMRRNRTEENRNPDQERDADAVRGEWTRI